MGINRLWEEFGVGNSAGRNLCKVLDAVYSAGCGSCDVVGCRGSIGVQQRRVQCARGSWVWCTRIRRRAVSAVSSGDLHVVGTLVGVRFSTCRVQGYKRLAFMIYSSFLFFTFLVTINIHALQDLDHARRVG